MDHKFIIWDDNARRINAMEPRLKSVLTRHGIKALIQSNCEPPLLSRFNLIGRTPAIQLDDGEFWHRKYGEEVTEDQFEELIKMFIAAKAF